ncbi:MAG: ribbon-helix-helix domain-containing protein [Pseudomonadota bacterium]
MSKSNLITFKVDDALADLLQGMSNRSEFIRAAILNALDSTCPLCKGSGILSVDQRRHWDEFARHHAIQECDDCHAWHIVCANDGEHHHGHRG